MCPFTYKTIIITRCSTLHHLQSEFCVTRQEWLEGEESSEVAGEVVRGLVDLAFYLGRDHCLGEQAFSHTVQAARASLLQIIEVNT